LSFAYSQLVSSWILKKKKLYGRNYASIALSNSQCLVPIFVKFDTTFCSFLSLPLDTNEHAFIIDPKYAFASAPSCARFTDIDLQTMKSAFTSARQCLLFLGVKSF
jgi:hypothetical protein